MRTSVRTSRVRVTFSLVRSIAERPVGTRGAMKSKSRASVTIRVALSRYRAIRASARPRLHEKGNNGTGGTNPVTGVAYAVPACEHEGNGPSLVLSSEIPSLLIVEMSVVRGIPSLAAAPFRPPTTPLA